jgi:hypothetical protein
MAKKYDSSMSVDEVVGICGGWRKLESIPRPTFEVGERILIQTDKSLPLPVGIWKAKILVIQESMGGRGFQLYIDDVVGPMSHVPMNSTMRYYLYVDNQFEACKLAKME